MRNRLVWALVLGIGMITAAASAAESDGAFDARCARLASLSLSGTDLQAATVVEAATATAAGQTLSIPKYCRVRAVIRPMTHVEVRLPVDEAWNRHFFQSGCGGLCGDVLTDYPHLFNSSLPGQARGYATATSDTGHTGGNTDGRWAYGDLAAEENFAYRSIGETARVAKALVKAFYEKPQAKSYFAGCSTGGRMAVKAALKYPAEFNGIVAGAPALDYPGLVGTAFAWLLRTNTDSQGRKVLTADTVSKVEQLYKTVIEQCDTVDGVTDGVISDPRLCKVDPRAQSCGITDGPVCLNRGRPAGDRAVAAGRSRPVGPPTLSRWPAGRLGTLLGAVADRLAQIQGGVAQRLRRTDRHGFSTLSGVRARRRPNLPRRGFPLRQRPGPDDRVGRVAQCRRSGPVGVPERRRQDGDVARLDRPAGNALQDGGVLRCGPQDPGRHGAGGWFPAVVHGSGP